MTINSASGEDVTSKDKYRNRNIFSNERGRKTSQYTASIAASFSAFSLGNALGWTSQISLRLLNGDAGFPINEDQLGWIGSFVSLGAAFLSLLIGPVCDFMGRKTTMLILILPLTLGWSLITWATNLEMLYIGRLFTGMVGGAFCVTAPLYCNEISEKEIRGTLGSFTQLMITSGIFFDAVVSKFISIQWFSVCCLTIPIVFGVIFVFMPETPVYLLKKGRLEEAKNSLKRLRGNNFDVQSEILEMNAVITKNHTSNAMRIILTSFKSRATKMALIISVGVMSFRILCGIDAITAYASYIFDTASTDLDPELGTIILILFQLISGICQPFIVDKFGRRVLLLTSEVMMSLCVIIVGICIFLKERGNIDEKYYVYLDNLPLAALCVFFVGFSLGIGPISFMMTAEVLPQDVKSLFASFATFVSWMLAFTVAKTFFIIKEGWGVDVAFFIYGGLSIIGTAFVFYFVPETKGKSYEEIQTLLKKE